jgi:hypothetical protein
METTIYFSNKVFKQVHLSAEILFIRKMYNYRTNSLKECKHHFNLKEVTN